MSEDGWSDAVAGVGCVVPAREAPCARPAGPASSVRRVLGWTPRDPKEAIVAAAETMVAGNLVAT